MQLPFTRAEFLDVFAALNVAVWPVQIVTVFLGLAVVGLLFWRPVWADRAIAAVLAATWLLTGVAYHWVHFSVINPLAWLFGTLFVVAGLVFAVEGVLRSRIRFESGYDWRTAVALLLVAYALLIYALVGLAMTAPWPETPLFGVAPCPTTIFTFGLLLVARHERKWLLTAVPVLWGVIGGSAAFLLAVPQDYGLIAAVVAWAVLQTGLARHPPARIR